MPRIKKGKEARAKGADQFSRPQPAVASVQPAVAFASAPALHPSSHAVQARASFAHEERGHGDDWSAPGHSAGEDDGDDGAWGEGAAEAGDHWGAPPSVERSMVDDWGAPDSGPTEWQSGSNDGWGEPPPSTSATMGFANAYGATVKGRPRQGSARNPQPSTPQAAQAPSPASFHPSAAVQMPPSQSWGAPAAAAAATGWDEPPSAWGQPPAVKPAKAQPAWTTWANEVKTVNTSPVPAASSSYPYTTQNAAAGGGTRQVLSEHQRSQILSSLLETPNQQTKGYFPQSQPQGSSHHKQQSAPRPSQAHQAFHPSQQAPHPSQQAFHPSQQAFHPSQQAFLDPQLLAEQQSILRSIQEHNTRSNDHSHHGYAQQSRPQPVQSADSWTNWGRDARGGERASTIPEEEEYEEEDNGWGDEEEEDDGWGPAPNYGGNQRVRFDSNVSYAGQTPSVISRTSRTPSHGPAPAPGTYPPGHSAHVNYQVWTPSSVSSRTMKMATGTFPTAAGTMNVEFAPPRDAPGKTMFIESFGEALRPAERALYNRDRPAKERIRWGFNPDKDPRVGSLLQWVAAMSSGLSAFGLQRFLDTRERGALFVNADFRVPSIAGGSAQPAFDWVPLTELQNTLDSTLQSSVTLYDPAFQVIVFVFLLSPTGNSMAVWRRKLNVPDALRDVSQGEILSVKAELKQNYPVYVDELPVKPDVAPKKKVRFAFIRRMFGGKKKAAA